MFNVDCGNHSIAPVPVKQSCGIWINKYHELTYDRWKKKKAKQDETYFVGHAVNWTENIGQDIDGMVYIGVDFLFTDRMTFLYVNMSLVVVVP